MLDDSDFDFALLTGASSMPDGRGKSGCGCLIAAICLLAVIAIGVAVAYNHEECEMQKCPDGQPSKLIAHECLCVQRPEK